MLSKIIIDKNVNIFTIKSYSGRWIMMHIILTFVKKVIELKSIILQLKSYVYSNTLVDEKRYKLLNYTGRYNTLVLLFIIYSIILLIKNVK